MGKTANKQPITSPTTTITAATTPLASHCDNESLSHGKPSSGFKNRCTATRVKSCLRTFLVHLFSHVGLCVIVVGYAICGGFLFNELESKPQQARKGGSIEIYQRTIYEAKITYVQHLWEITEKFNVLYEREWNLAVEAELTLFGEIISNSTELKRISEEEITWTFSRALLYSVSIITTIGYGDLAPKTEAGRILTMFYAVLGVPLMLLWVSNIGTVMANTFKFIYVHARCCSSVTPPSTSTTTASSKKNSVSNNSLKPVQPSAQQQQQQQSIIVCATSNNKRKNSKNSSTTSESSNNVKSGVRTNSILSRKSNCADQQTPNSTHGPPAASSAVEYSVADRKYETRLVDSSQSSLSPFCCQQPPPSSPLLSLKDLHTGAKQVLLECAQYNLNNCCQGGQDEENSRRILQQLYYNNVGSIVHEDGSRSSGGGGGGREEESEDGGSEVDSVIEIKVAPPPPPPSSNHYFLTTNNNSAGPLYPPDPSLVMSMSSSPLPCCTVNFTNDCDSFFQQPPPPPPPFGYGTAVMILGGTGQRKSSYGSTGSGTNMNNPKKYLTMSPSAIRHSNNSSGMVIRRPLAAAEEDDDDDSITIMQGTPSRVPLLQNESLPSRGPPDLVDIDNCCCSDYEDFTSPMKVAVIPKSSSPTDERLKNPKIVVVDKASSTEPDIPISLVLFVVITYILAGATAFTFLEDWGFVEGAYFCFITLSTIGLGDILPGKTVDSVTGSTGSTAGAAKLVFCCLYLVLGLAIIAMSFNLVQEKVSTGVKNFGKRIGVLKDDDEIYK